MKTHCTGTQTHYRNIDYQIKSCRHMKHLTLGMTTLIRLSTQYCSCNFFLNLTLLYSYAKHTNERR